MSQNQDISKKEQYNLNKLQKRLRRNVGEAIADFNMIENLTQQVFIKFFLNQCVGYYFQLFHEF